MMIIVIVLSLLLITACMLYTAARNRETLAAQRLDIAMGTSGLVVPGTELGDHLAQVWYRRLLFPVFRRLGAGLLTATSPNLVERTRRRLETAGRPDTGTLVTFMVIKGVLLLLGLAGVAAIIGIYRGPLHITIAAAALTLLATLLLPEAVLNMMIRQCQAEIRRSLPDVIDLLAVSTEAGMGLDGALTAVMRRKPGPLSAEFGRVLLEIQLGKQREEAWADMAERVDMDELRSFESALRQAEQLGVSIANTLRAQSDVLRLKHSMIVRQQAATLALRMLFPLIFFILPALFVVILGPAVMSIHHALANR